MQWLIDIIKAWVIAQGYLTTSYIDRGDPAVPDFLCAAFTFDASWRDLDCSGVVPAGAKAILFTIRLSCNGVGVDVKFRKNGNVNENVIARISPQLANVYICEDFVCACDVNRIIEYFGYAFYTYDTTLTIKGWWL